MKTPINWYCLKPWGIWIKINQYNPVVLAVPMQYKPSLLYRNQGAPAEDPSQTQIFNSKGKVTRSKVPLMNVSFFFISFWGWTQCCGPFSAKTLIQRQFWLSPHRIMGPVLIPLPPKGSLDAIVRENNASCHWGEILVYTHQFDLSNSFLIDVRYSVTAVIWSSSWCPERDV